MPPSVPPTMAPVLLDVAVLLGGGGLLTMPVVVEVTSEV